ncbi:heme-binding domain-containing protein, partial [Escherichia coli]
MKMVSRITAIGLAGVAICYLGLSGYVWYHDNKRSKQADVQASAVSENNQVLGFLREKGCDYCHTPSAELPAYYYIPGAGNDSNLLIVFYVQIMPDDFVMQLHR